MSPSTQNPQFFKDLFNLFSKEVLDYTRNGNIFDPIDAWEKQVLFSSTSPDITIPRPHLDGSLLLYSDIFPHIRSERERNAIQKAIVDAQERQKTIIVKHLYEKDIPHGPQKIIDAYLSANSNAINLEREKKSFLHTKLKLNLKK